MKNPATGRVFLSEPLQDSSPDSERWPLTLAGQYRMNAALADALVVLMAQTQDPDQHRVFKLASGSILAHGYHLAMVAAVVAESPEHSEFAAVPIADYFRTGDGQQPPIEFQPLVFERPSYPRLRQFARVASWCPIRRLPRAMIAPDAVAITHNGLLCAEASRHAIGFRHATTILGRAPAREIEWSDKVESLADRVGESLAAALAFSGALGRRFCAAIAAVARRQLAHAASDLARLRGADDLPTTIWSGSGGYWPARAIGLEVLRRGGTVFRFDHGGDHGIRRAEPGPALSDFIGTSDFVCPSAAIAARLARGGVKGPASLIERPRFHGGHGDPSYSGALRPRVPGKAQRVLYGTPPAVGPRGMFPPIFPDTVGLSLQRYLVRTLKSLPIELILRPHPEGLRGGRSNPLAELHPCAELSYEELLPSVDVLLFDHIATTTFTVALCSDRPIVMLDYGIEFFEDDIERLLDKRCARVRVEYDERNLPYVDRDQLHTIITNLPNRVDPEPFRSMFLGEFAT